MLRLCEILFLSLFIFLSFQTGLASADSYWQRPISPQQSLHPENCGSCHKAQYDAWKGSLHSKAMSPGLRGQLNPDHDPEFAASCYLCHAPLTEQAEVKKGAGVKGQGARGKVESIMVAAFPVADQQLINPEAEQDMQMVMDLILAVRNIRGVMNIPPSTQLTVIVKPGNGELGSHLAKNGEYVKTLARVKELRINVNETKPRAAATAVIKDAEVYVPLEGVLDLDEERARLAKEIEKIARDIEMFAKKLSNKNFVDKAPKAVVEKDTARFEELKAMREKLEQSLKMLG